MEIYRRIKKTYDTWGIKRPVKIGDKFTGFAAPLWRNASPGFFLGLAILEFILFFIFVIVFAVVVTPVPACIATARILIVLQIIFLAINFVLDCKYYLTARASDTQWSRNIVGSACLCLCMNGLAVISFLIGSIIAGGATSNNCGASSSTSPETPVNIALAIFVCVVSYGRLALIIYFWNAYFRHNRDYLDVERSDDEENK